MNTTILGYPRIGADRELKVATEDYWAGRVGADALAETGAELRAEVWTGLRDAGVDGIPSNTFSFYDQMLDTSVLVDAVPERYRRLDGLDRYFAMARGVQDVPPLEMTKWFDTNYHYIVPELGPDTRFRLADGAADRWPSIGRRRRSASTRAPCSSGRSRICCWRSRRRAGSGRWSCSTGSWTCTPRSWSGWPGPARSGCSWTSLSSSPTGARRRSTPWPVPMRGSGS